MPILGSFGAGGKGGYGRGGKKLYALDFVVVAGGGAAARGGGGAGGYRVSYGCCSVSALELETGCYTVTVGAGGSSAPGYISNKGGDSIFNPAGDEGTTKISATGGGRGNSGIGGSAAGFYGPFDLDNPLFNGQGNEGGYSPPEGNPGGQNPSENNLGRAGGGGGANQAGGNVTPSSPGGPGGDGKTSTITGSPITKAGGGGGNSQNSGSSSGGAGGGAAGSTSGPQSGFSAAANTGSGGGGYADGSPSSITTAGGSGIVYLRAPSSAGLSISPGCSGSVATLPCGEKVATFTATGTLTIS
jgi:hypothetical protein